LAILIDSIVEKLLDDNAKEGEGETVTAVLKLVRIVVETLSFTKGVP